MKRSSRRSFLQMAAYAALASAGGIILNAKPAGAGSSTPMRRFLFCYFGGGWDQMLCFDPRENNGSYSICNPAYDLLNDTAVDAILSSTGQTGVRSVPNAAFKVGPGVPDRLMSHLSDFNVVRGINMGTLTHDIGRRYFLTGRFPAGLLPVGNSVPTWVSSRLGMEAAVPNLSLNTEGYNVSEPAYASPIPVADSNAMQNLLQTLGEPLSATAKGVIADFEAKRRCRAEELDGDMLITNLEDSYLKAAEIVGSNHAADFDFRIANGELQSLYDAFEITKTTDFTASKGLAALVGQALGLGISQSASVRLVGSLDTHQDWDTDHLLPLRDALDALGMIVSFLKSNPAAEGSSESAWDYTTVVAFSEFARGPSLNNSTGRDHHLASCALVGGGKNSGIAHGKLVGGTTLDDMSTQAVDLATGNVSDGGHVLTPADLHYTVLKSMGIEDATFGNTAPQIITPLLG